MLRVEHVQLDVINSKYNTSEVTCDKKSRYMASFQEATYINPMTHAFCMKYLRGVHLSVSEKYVKEYLWNPNEILKKVNNSIKSP